METQRIKSPDGRRAGEAAAVFRAFAEAVEARIRPPDPGPKVRVAGAKGAER